MKPLPALTKVTALKIKHNSVFAAFSYTMKKQKPVREEAVSVQALQEETDVELVCFRFNAIMCLLHVIEHVPGVSCCLCSNIWVFVMLVLVSVCLYMRVCVCCVVLQTISVGLEGSMG